MLSSTLALLVVFSTATQVAAPAPVPAGRKYRLDRPALLHFEVPTSTGVIKGAVKIVRLDLQGLDGRGRFEIRGTIDPASVVMADAVLAGHVARWVLSSARGSLVFGSSKRLPAVAVTGSNAAQADPRLGAGIYLDARRGGRYLEVRYRFSATQENARVEVKTKIPLSGLGLRNPKHPFIEITGPIRLSFDARVARR